MGVVIQSCLNPCFNGRYSQRVLSTTALKLYDCLNPCFNGRYSQRGLWVLKSRKRICLNPCFNGRYSQSCIKVYNNYYSNVLILVLMEDTLRDSNIK